MENKDLFIKTALGYDRGINSGDHKKANKFHKELMELKMIMDSDRLLELCMDLISNENDSVRLWAATLILDQKTDLAARTLTEIASTNQVVGLTAKLLLNAHKKGLV